jgi:uncharacterized membrane protein YccC
MTLRRAAHRTAGTLVGLLGAVAILAPDPSLGVLVAVVVALQFVTESVIVASYAIAVVFITGLALLMLQLGHPEAGAGLLGARLLDTLAGCALGAFAGATLWRRSAERRLPALQAATIRASAHAIGAALDHDPALRRRRHDVAAALADLAAVQRDVAADTRGASQWPLTHATERLGHIALSLPLSPDPHPDAPAFAAALATVAADLEDGANPHEVPSIASLPHTAAAVEALRAQLRTS